MSSLICGEGVKSAVTRVIISSTFAHSGAETLSTCGLTMWRRFQFFEKETLAVSADIIPRETHTAKDASGKGGDLSRAHPAAASARGPSGEGLLLLGDTNGGGVVHVLDATLTIRSSFPAHSLSVLHMFHITKVRFISDPAYISFQLFLFTLEQPVVGMFHMSRLSLYHSIARLESSPSLQKIRHAL